MSAQPQQRVVATGELGDVPLHVVLVEPEIPPNTGNVARMCAATGCALHLVEPLGFSIDDRALKRAGLDYWPAVRLVVHPSLAAFLAAFPAERCWWIETTGTLPYTEAAFARGDALVFGKETGALPADLLEGHRARTLRIPMRAGAVRSINLSTAAGIVTYAALAALDFPNLT
ncbi:MAG TPA: tRNA (cytidine(34)-2'-O)-methyltransferase [Candidatus Lustribacter sp.]|jgi:tRNA (cytidine/uridine-2'-O-)-methyltransferase|nr:tRNA (cytidine(34)-2'-O)-methyltransferase [Candidatus Lustribacter sp.]